MHTILDPSFITVDNSTWANTEKRDEYLGAIIEQLELIDVLRLPPLAWSGKLQQFAFSPSTLPPWRIDKDFSIPLTSIFFDLFNKLTDYIEDINIEPCSSAPELACHVNGEDLKAGTLELAHKFLVDSQNFLLILSKINKFNHISFSCDCHRRTYTPLCINEISDWFDFPGIEHHIWASFERDFSNFSLILKAMIKTMCGNERSCIYKFTCSKKFKKQLLGETNNRKTIIKNIATRLSLTQKEASSKASINDEPVKSSDGIRRFRTSGSSRVHYEYTDNNKLHFLEYYPDGKHDAGL